MPVFVGGVAPPDHRHIRVSAILVALAAVCALAFADTASANYTNYCDGYFQPHTSCDGPGHTLTANSMYMYSAASRKVCAAASESFNGPLYASYVCGLASATHYYPCVCHGLYGRAHNGDDVVEHALGQEEW